MAITKGRQTLFIRDHDSLDPFEWAGGCSALASLRAPVGDIDIRTGLYDPAALFQPTPEIEVEAGPGPIEDTLTVQKAVRAALIEQWLFCRWDVDIRYQECGRRDDRANWVAISRLCRAKFLEYATDGNEVITTQEDDGAVLINSPIKAPWPLVHMWRLTAGIINASPTEDFTSIAVCEHAQCADAVGLAYGCVMRIGTTGFYAAPEVWTSTDEGETWTIETLSDWAGDIEDIDCLGDFAIVVSAHDGAVMWTEGTLWTEVALPGRPWGVAIHDPGLILVVGEEGHIWRSQDTARTFTLVDAGVTTPLDLYEVVIIDSQIAWAIGDSNVLVRSEDGGSTWSLVAGPSLQGGVDVTAILALDENRVLLGYADGELWLTENGSGTSPTWMRDPSLTAFTQISHIAECGCGRVMVVGYDADDVGVVYESVDSGAPGTWEVIAVPATMGAIADVTCCDANTWLAVGAGVYMGGEIGQILKME